MNQHEEHLARVADCAARELRDQVTDEEKEFLYNHSNDWLTEVINFKRRAETSITSCNVRMFALGVERRNNKLTQNEYDAKLLEELTKRVNSSRFIQQVEMKIASLKRYDTSS